MRNILKYTILTLLMISGVSCSRESLLQEPFVPGNNTIILDIASSVSTKAIEDEVLASESHEAYVENIDIFIFGEQAPEEGQPTSSVYYERISYSTANPGQKTLSVNKSRFKADTSYDVYVIANCSLAEADLESVTSFDDLVDMIQTDEFVHMSGLNGEGLPKTFLMDARAFTDDAKTQAILNPSAREMEDVILKAELARAAAKIVVELYESDNVEFQNPDNSHVYHIRNLPYNTSLVAGHPLTVNQREIRSTLAHQVNDYVIWDKDATAADTPNVSVTAYVYEYNYRTAPLDEHTSLVINIPMISYVDDGTGNMTEVLYEANYYKIPLSRDLNFERNHFYRIRATVNAPGAQSNYDPIELKDLTYDVLDWSEYLPIISVGDESSRPQYLQLNTDFVKMYNVNEDNTSLTFASSSPIASVELLEAYYYNKHGAVTQVQDNIRQNISAIADPGVLNGRISIFSPIVATTQQEREEMKSALGPAPADPGVERPTNPEVPYAAEPNPDDYLPQSGWGTTYSYTGEGENVQFFYTDWLDRTSPAESIQNEYDQDYAAYLAYQAWMNNPNKDELIAEYNQLMEEYEELYSDYNAYVSAVERINSTVSPSHYNTIRYLKFRVTNEQGLVQEFSVEQYPVIYITNSLGWYSYRKDFKTGSNAPTTYEAAGPDRYVGVSLNITGDGKYDWTNNYSTSASGYWFSKVRTGTNTSGSTQVSSYQWSQGGNLTTDSQSNTNLRLYHVHVTTTSEDYVVGRPEMMYDENLQLYVTDPGEDNSRLVSPSFMIASRLGYFVTNAGNLNRTNDQQRLEIFRVHCANYVEVHGDASNPIVYDNWRLPTEAELKIIMETQGESGENAAAVDYLLNADYYFGAAGPVWNSKNDSNTAEGASSTSKSVRCVRDEY